MRLYISGGAHITKKSTVEDRVNKISSKLHEIDAVFVEGREDIGVSQKAKYLNWLFLPFMFLVMGSYLFFLSKISKRSDSAMIEKLANRHNVPDDMIYEVDKSPHVIVKSNRNRWAHLYWTQTGFYLVLAALLTNLFSHINVVMLVGLIIFISLAVGFFFLLIYVYTAMTERNVYMLREINEYSQREDIESACLIVGKEHETELKDLCASSME